ncbi:hypothetical protein VHUM_04315 [Vanrija humicola]|uniref:Capsular associated protein n=1 Tax=Vanrija humicola TaxID=5417 RepID=A0A7D8UWF3_VANHU|nr:hypothetical protein VHUM_04315 [Vanrija humicola]
MSLRPRAHGGAASPLPIEPDTPMAHYTDRMDSLLGGGSDEKLRAASLAHVHEHAAVGEKRGGGAGARVLSLLGVRRGRGRFGLSQRAWLALTVVVGFVLFTKLIMTNDTHTHHTHDPTFIIPRDYLNNSATDRAPFDFCPVFGPGDAIAARRGQFELLRSRLHLGTGNRVQRVLRKAMSGMPITISVLGGSVTACQGAGDDLVAPECYPHRFYDWWNTVFPHPNNELTNGAVKRTDSAYFAYCSSHHLPDRTDLVILEFDTVDPNDQDWLGHFELLVRSILLRKEQPAVIILGHFSPEVQAQNGFAGPELLHNAVAQFYDVPHITTKGVMYETYLEQPQRTLVSLYTDSELANKEGHDLIADVLISYIMSQICEGWSTLLGHSYNVPSMDSISGESIGGTPVLFGGAGLRQNQVPGQSKEDGATEAEMSVTADPGLSVPPMRLNSRPGELEKFRESEPFCVAASDLVNPLPSSIFLGSGWHAYHPSKNSISEHHHYWYADQPTSRLRVPLRIGAGDVGIYYLQGPASKGFGTARCWVDDNVEGARKLDGTANVEEPIATLTMIDRFVSRGSHFVECVLDGELGGPATPFKILGM